MKKQDFALFEKDNAYEINNYDVTVDQLKKIKIPDYVLSSEVYLREFYGDVIFSGVQSDALDEQAKKKVQKIGEEDMSVDKQYRQLCEEIDNSEFDKKLDEIIM